MPPRLAPLLLLAFSHLAAQGLSLPEALREAWARQPGLQAGQAGVDKARLEAEAAAALGLPTLQAQAGILRTDEPMMAFGLKLNQGRIRASDFDPASLNRPQAATGLGASLSVLQPLYAGGRIRAGRRAAEAMMEAEAALQAHRKQQVALGVVQAYFGVQAAAAGVIHAREALKAATEAEAFLAARVEAGLLLRADLARVRAWRGQCEAALSEARRQEGSARSALALLTGLPSFGELATPLEAPGEAAPPPGPHPGLRADLRAGAWQTEAAKAYAQGMGGALRPEVGLGLALGTARESLGGAAGTWRSASLGAKWTFSAADARREQAARAGIRAAELTHGWQRAQAERDAADAQGSVEAAQARVRASLATLAAAEEARDLRLARHREGLLPLTDLLDAETALAGARALRLASLLELRIANAQKALALGTPIEGVTE